MSEAAKQVGRLAMRVTSIEPLTRNASGQLLSGMCEFADGKRWRFIRVGCDGSYCFLIDSGVPSQWGFGNYGRTVAYPKRVEALKAKLAETGELIGVEPEWPDARQAPEHERAGRA